MIAAPRGCAARVYRPRKRWPFFCCRRQARQARAQQHQQGQQRHRAAQAHAQLPCRQLAKQRIQPLERPATRADGETADQHTDQAEAGTDQPHPTLWPASRQPDTQQAKNETEKAEPQPRPAVSQGLNDAAGGLAAAENPPATRPAAAGSARSTKATARTPPGPAATTPARCAVCAFGRCAPCSPAQPLAHQPTQRLEARNHCASGLPSNISHRLLPSERLQALSPRQPVEVGAVISEFAPLPRIEALSPR